jgi:hypothetical protein
MSIRIIKPGKSNYQDKFYAVCNNCGAEFVCGKRDGKYVAPSVIMGQQTDGYVSVNCPSCGRGCTAFYTEDNSSLKDIYDQ